MLHKVEGTRIFKILIRLRACLLLSLSLPLLVHFAKSFVLSSVCLFFLPPLRLCGWRWRPLINFSRWLALFVRRYGIFPLRFSNRSSILDPLDPSIAFCLLLSFSLSPSLILSCFFPEPPTGSLSFLPPRISPYIRECAWAADSAARTARIRERMQRTKKKTREHFFYSRNARSNMNMH